MAAAKNSKPSELTDIPLTLDQGDSVELTTAKSEKLKTNSLKRFFRTARSGMSSSKSSESPEGSAVPDDKFPRSSINLRFGSFHKHDGIDDTEASSSTELPKSKSSIESRVSLQGRLSTYWSNVFKKTSKKSATDVQAQQNVDTQTTEPNKSETL